MADKEIQGAIKHLESKIKLLQTAKKALEKVVDKVEHPQPKAKAKTVSPASITQSQKVLRVLGRAGKKGASRAEIAKSTGIKVDAVSWILNTLKKKRKVKNRKFKWYKV